ncbi:MAG TPA: substrate-binding domain-containing protein [Gemmatimonadaceae bacterium]
MSSRSERPLSAAGERALLALPLLALLAVAAPRSRARELQAAPVQSTLTARDIAAATAFHGRVLRVCADPNNLPFSNARGEGIENHLAELVAREIGATVQYEWWAQRRGFIRSTIKADLCDVVMGVPTSFDMLLTTRPYYRSTYVFVTKRDAPYRITSFDDPRLRRLRIGVQLIGDDYANAPPSHALSKRGIIDNVRGYTVYGDYAETDPPARIIDAVAKGDVDVAVAWGPLAGYFAAREPARLALTPVTPQIELPYLPFVFDISMGVRRGDVFLRDELDGVLVRRRASIDSLLQSFGVPRVDRPAAPNVS